MLILKRESFFTLQTGMKGFVVFFLSANHTAFAVLFVLCYREKYFCVSLSSNFIDVTTMCKISVPDAHTHTHPMGNGQGCNICYQLVGRVCFVGDEMKINETIWKNRNVCVCVLAEGVWDKSQRAVGWNGGDGKEVISCTYLLSFSRLFFCPSFAHCWDLS